MLDTSWGSPSLRVSSEIAQGNIKMTNNLLRFFWIVLIELSFAYSSATWGESIAKELIPPLPARQQELLILLRQDCGSCHGLLFEGGLGSPLTPAALKGKPVESFREAILYGRGTMMPPWNPFISEAEADWIVQLLLKGLP